MYSNITDAWTHDPVREMSDKLSNGAFRNNNDSQIYNLKNSSNNNVIHSPIQYKNRTKTDLNLSEANSLSLLSENPTDTKSIDFKSIDSDFSPFAPYAPAKFDKYSKKKNYKIPKGSQWDSDDDSDSIHDSRCNYSVKHLKKCDRCYDNLKKLVNKKVNERFDEIMLDAKLKQLQTLNSQPINVSTVPLIQTGNNISYKEILIIVVGAIIALIIIFLIVKR